MATNLRFLFLYMFLFHAFIAILEKVKTVRVRKYEKNGYFIFTTHVGLRMWVKQHDTVNKFILAVENSITKILYADKKKIESHVNR